MILAKVATIGSPEMAAFEIKMESGASGVFELYGSSDIINDYCIGLALMSLSKGSPSTFVGFFPFSKQVSLRDLLYSNHHLAVLEITVFSLSYFSPKDWRRVEPV